MRRLIIFVLVLLCANAAHAAVETITGVGVYYVSDDETLAYAKEQAELSAEVSALEQAAVFVKSYTAVNNFRLSDDEIIAIAAGILYVKDVSHEIGEEFDGMLVVKATVTAEIDTDEVAELLEREIQRRNQTHG